MQRRHFVTSVLVTPLVALFSGSPVWAGIDPQPFRTGLFGVTAGQTIRVSVANAAGVFNACFTPEVLVSAVRFRDLAGALLFESKGEVLTDGMGMSVDFQPIPDDGAPSPGGALTPGPVPAPAVRSRRLQVRAEIVIGPVPNDGLPVPDDGVPVPEDGRAICGGVLLTLEVFDVVTGRTAFTMPFAKVAFNPQPEPPEPIRPGS